MFLATGFDAVLFNPFGVEELLGSIRSGEQRSV